jgi:hypothetical protein
MQTETTFVPVAPPTLGPDDINSIRNLMPYDWRKQIAGATGLTERQISEVFYLRTSNPDHNFLVWAIIRRKLKALHMDDLATKVNTRIKATNIKLK